MRSKSSIPPLLSLRDSSIFPRRRRFSKMFSAGGQVPTQIFAPASASDLAMANPYPASSATPATRARFPVRSIGSIAPFSRAPPQDAGESLLGSPLPDGGGRRRDVLVPGPSQPEQLPRDPDELHQLGIAPALLRLVVEELDRPLAGAVAVIRAVGGDGV